ncbi:MAG: ElyC/SanA/YdcF family protein, partial [Bacillota bacterium]|nr:ElyC/SanA/YdcF family protein [Bacillota bacterium]
MNFKSRKRTIQIFILFTLSFMCIIYSLIMKSYHITFSGFFFLLGILFCVFGFVKLKPLSFIKSNFLRKTIKITYRFILGCFIISVFVIEGLILSSAWEKNISKPDYIVVLGAGLWGKTPSQILQQRLDASIDIINKYPDVKVILSGGQGPGEDISEAESMKLYLVNKGISEDRLLLEQKSTSTLENLTFSSDLIRKTYNKNNFKITIVTSNFHMYRAQLISKRLGISSYGYSADIANYLKPTYFTREYFALVKSIIFDKPIHIAPAEVGTKVDSYKGVNVYNNGKDYSQNNGKNYSKDGYYYGYKWQCVEFIKRFYYEANGHKMPDVYGNAKDFFDTNIKQGGFNKNRGLYQYKNGDNV